MVHEWEIFALLEAGRNNSSLDLEGRRYTFNPGHPAENLKKAKEKGISSSLPVCSCLAGKPIYPLVLIKAYFCGIPLYTKD